MTTYADYSTVYDIRAEYLAGTKDADDALLASFIASVSRQIDTLAARYYYPRIETHYFDVPVLRNWRAQYATAEAVMNGRLLLDDDLLEVTTFTNGDGSTFTTGQYKLYPLNKTPKNEIAILPGAGAQWLPPSSGDYEGAISIAGVWGYHADYASAWADTSGVLAAGVDGSTTTWTATAGTIRAGYLLKAGSEYAYVRAVQAGSTTDTLTVVRGVNGSTAAAHLISVPLYRWYQPHLDMLVRVCVTALVRLRDNPIGNTINLNGVAFSTPRDIDKYIIQQLTSMNLLRAGMG